MPRASNNQMNFLQSQGVGLPAPQRGWQLKRWGQGDAERIIAFIKEGNGAGAAAPEARLALYLAEREKYEGKIIWHTETGWPRDAVQPARYLLLYLVPQNAGQVRRECKPGTDPSQVYPFECVMVKVGEPIDYKGHICAGYIGQPQLASH